MAPSLTQLLIVLAIVVLLFGTKKLRGIGSDLGSAIKSFKKEVSPEDKKSEDSKDEDPAAISEQKSESADESVASKQNDKV